MCHKQEKREIERVLAKGLDMGGFVHKLEEGMKKSILRGKGKGGLLENIVLGSLCRSFWSEKFMRKWGRRILQSDAILPKIRN